MANVDNLVSVLEMRAVQDAAHTIGFEVTALEIRRADDIGLAFEAQGGTPKHFGSVLTRCCSPTGFASLAIGARLPTMVSNWEFVAAGGLLSYGPSFLGLFRRGGDCVDKIPRGAKPPDLPVEQPTKFDLVISLTTAKALGLTVPPTAACARFAQLRTEVARQSE